MIKGILRRLRAKRAKEAETAALIAKRARGSNQRPDVAEAYRRVHETLTRGPRNAG
jgi:hypothetical protein